MTPYGSPICVSSTAKFLGTKGLSVSLGQTVALSLRTVIGCSPLRWSQPQNLPYVVISLSSLLDASPHVNSLRVGWGLHSVLFSLEEVNTSQQPGSPAAEFLLVFLSRRKYFLLRWPLPDVQGETHDPRCLESQVWPLMSQLWHNISVPSIREQGLPYITEMFSVVTVLSLSLFKVKRLKCWLCVWVCILLSVNFSPAVSC